MTDLKKHATSPTHLNLRNLVSFHIISEFSRTRQMPLYLYIYICVYNPYITNHRELQIYQSELRNIMKHPYIHHSLSFFIYPNLSMQFQIQVSGGRLETELLLLADDATVKSGSRGSGASGDVCSLPRQLSSSVGTALSCASGGTGR